MSDLFSNPKFAGYAQALANARAGRSGIEGMKTGRAQALAMQDAQRARDEAKRQAAIRARQRKALEELLEKQGPDAAPTGQRMAAIAGLSDPAQGLLEVGSLQTAAQERERREEALRSVGSVYASTIDSEDPLAMQVKGLLEDPDTVQQGITLAQSGLLDDDVVDPAEVSDKMYEMFTVESLGKFQRSGNANDLVRIVENEEGESVSREGADAQRMLGRLRSLAANPTGLAKLYGGPAGIQGMLPAMTEEARNAQADLDNIISTLQLVEAGKMKGQGTITENERALIREAATTLSNSRLPEAEALRELDRIGREIAPILEREFKLDSTAIPTFSGGLLGEPEPASGYTRAAGGGRSQPRQGTREYSPEEQAALQKYGVGS